MPSVDQMLRSSAEIIHHSDDRTLLLWVLFAIAGLSVWIFYSLFTQQRALEAKRVLATDQELTRLRDRLSALEESMREAEVRHSEEKTRLLEQVTVLMADLKNTLLRVTTAMDNGRWIEPRAPRGGRGGS